MIKKLFVFLFLAIFINQVHAKGDIMILKLKDGDVVIELFSDIAPNHVERIKKRDGPIGSVSKPDKIISLSLK